MEALITGLVDNYPQTLLKHRRKFTVGMCFIMFIAGIPMCTNVSSRVFLTYYVRVHGSDKSSWPDLMCLKGLDESSGAKAPSDLSNLDYKRLEVNYNIVIIYHPSTNSYP